MLESDPRLQRYLPEAAVDLSPEALRAHLNAVLRAVLTYVPRYVIEHGSQAAFDQETLLFADISGFTAMSERLSQLGREGAEVITGIVNDYFNTMLALLAQYGGDLYKFGGDALLAAFRNENTAARACAAAQAMQQAMQRFEQLETPQGIFALRMKIGISTGKVLLISLGSRSDTPQGAGERLEFAVLGPAVMGIAQSEHQAPAGSIVLDEATRQALTGSAAVLNLLPAAEPGFWQIGASLPAQRLNNLQADPKQTNQQPVDYQLPATGDLSATYSLLSTLSSYLPPALLARIVALTSASGQEQRRVEGEHRRVTVLFANFYGIDEWIASANSEDLDELETALEEHFSSAQQIIARYGGIINKVDSYAVGYRIMAIFGAPVAHEEDPLNAVRAALDLQQSVLARRQLQTRRGAFTFKQRVGINTGYVFAGSLGSGQRQEYSVIGDEVNLAARLMGVAQDGQILISAATAQVTGSAFNCVEMDPVRVKGKAQAVHNFAVQSASSQPEGDRLSGTAELVYVGRQAELQQAMNFLSAGLQTAASDENRPHLMEICGETGIGKTRFAAHLISLYLDASRASFPCSLLNGQAASYGHLTPYLPWLPALRRMLTISVLTSLDLQEWSPLVAEVLGIPSSQIDWQKPEHSLDLLVGLDARMRQQRFFDIVLQVFQAAAREKPLLLFLEDMHWADATSLELLDYLLRSRGLRLTVIVTRRPQDVTGEAPEMSVAGIPHLRLLLSGLDSQGCARLAQEELDWLASSTVESSSGIAPSLARLIYERSQGNPLYIEEITRSLYAGGALRLEQADLSEGSDGASGIGIWQLNAAVLDGSALLNSSTNLASLLMSRLDSLPENARRLLQFAAITGQTFRPALLAQIQPETTPAALNHNLQSLTSQGLLLFNPPEDYSFKSALLQEVAYESLPFARRREIHAKVGQALELGNAAPAELARHFDEARIYTQALHYRNLAGERARAEYASQAALAHYRRALEILPLIENASTTASSDELTASSLHEAIGDILLLTGDYEAAVEAYHSAAPEFPPSPEPQRANLLWKEARVYEKQGRYTEALACLENGITLLTSYSSPSVKGTISRPWLGVNGETPLLTLGRLLDFKGWVYSRLGDHDRALQACQTSRDLFTRLPEDQIANELSSLYNSFGSVYMGQGSYTKARESFEQSLHYSDLAQNLSRQSMAYNNLAAIAWSQGNLEQAQEYLSHSLETSRRIGDLHSQAMLYNNLGVVAFSLEQPAEALQRYQRSLAVCRRLGDQPGAAQALTNIGEAQLALGELEAANSALLDAAAGFIALNREDSGPNVELPEVYRLLVEVGLQKNDLETALSYATEALQIAEQAQNPEMSGVAARNLGRVYARLGRRSEAGQTLRLSLERLAQAESPEETEKTERVMLDLALDDQDLA